MDIKAAENQYLLAALEKRSSQELINFREHIVQRKIDTPRAWAIRFIIVQILLDRHLLAKDATPEELLPA